jgi:hypothetical protein
MNDRQRTFRDRKIVQLYEQGLAPSNISEKVGIQTQRVRTILSEHGFDLTVALPAASRQDGMWEMTESKRRLAVWERARRAARVAIKAMA